MGCGASVLRAEDRHNNHFHYKLARPITEESPQAPPSPLNVPSFNHAKPPSAANVVDHDQSDEMDDAITGAASPSFREYCVISTPPSDIEHSHDEPDTVETIDNMDNDEPMVGKSTTSRMEITNPKKEQGEKKERKGSKFRDVINKGRAGGKKIGLVRHRSENIELEDSREKGKKK